MDYQKETYIRLKSSGIFQNVLFILTAGIFFLAWNSPSQYEKNAEEVSITTGNISLRDVFQETLDSMRVSYDLPGATAAYVLKDGTAGVAASGFADVEVGTPMTPKSRMLAASIGKTFVGATAVSLADEGVLDLDVPIVRWLGDRSWFTRLPNHDSITLRHLLTHRSGLPNHVYMDEFAAEASRRWRAQNLPFPPDSLVQFILDKPPLFEVSEGWAYTDTGFILVGMIIEQATGRGYYALIEERFLIPLNLKFTSPSNTRVLSGLASGYAAENAFGFPEKTTTSEGEMVWHPGIEWTGGGLVSTSSDLARWGAYLFGGKALSGEALNLLLDSKPIDSSNPKVQYGMGVAIYQDGPYGRVYGHGGWIPGYSSSLRFYEDYGVTIAFQINTDIGIVEDTSSVVQTMESRLAEIVLSSKQ
ncbi:D-alanyl-D-alanine carboxypeptidase [Fodinibius roseus]|uniref:D-alanyl-D-alanine carboxypeptidase n=1 Tax=Fodinibius roseus TaxID=1194090 RepID=A0A1M4ZXP7_9BACT|nr:serine hydrolase domain-containing protein [Fodinibius roseus]SHF22627.1 D-alanyl-D-alanine carboxypeptidase [Fodinibius roseus]